MIVEAADHIGVNKVAEGPLEDPNKGEGDNKTIKGANTKITTLPNTVLKESMT